MLSSRARRYRRHVLPEDDTCELSITLINKIMATVIISPSQTYRNPLTFVMGPTVPSAETAAGRRQQRRRPRRQQRAREHTERPAGHLQRHHKPFRTRQFRTFRFFVILLI